MSQNEMQKKFIESAMVVVAREGLENTTTRKIADEADLSESHIFRCFNGKEDLLQQAFDEANNRSSTALLKWLPILQNEEFDYKTRCQIVFLRYWKFMRTNADLSLFYIRYYHSAFYEKYMQDYAGNPSQPLIEKAKTFFPNTENVDFLLNYILDTAFNFAAKVLRGELPDSEDTFLQVFELIYNAGIIQLHNQEDVVVEVK